MPSRKTRKGRKQRKRSRHTRQKGGVRIIKGDKADIHRPPLPCKNDVNMPYRSNAYIGKLTNTSYEATVNKIKTWLSSIDPEEVYTVPPILSCTLAEKQTNTNIEKGYMYQEIQKYGGISLHERLANQEESLKEILTPLKPFLNHLVEFNRQFLHRDLHTGNIVWDGTVYKMIDFEMMTPKDIEKETIREELFFVYGQNDKPTNTKDFESELNHQTDLLMKYYDINMLIQSLVEDLQPRIEPHIYTFFGKVQLAPYVGMISPYHDMKDYSDAFSDLFSVV